MGPYKLLLQSDTCKKDVEEWEIRMHEALAKDDVADEALQSLTEVVGGTFDDKASLVKALGVYGCEG